jgi:hypothetical protein
LNKGERTFPQGLTAAERDDWQHLNEMSALVALLAPWLEDEPDALKVFELWLQQENLQLTDELRHEVRKVIMTYQGRLKVLQVRDTAFGSENLAGFRKVGYSQACEVAEWARASLPTEAQWEVAARLQAAGRLSADEMQDHVLEWCCDYYAHDYFHRTGDFADPKGPQTGRLSKEQLRKLTDSGIGIVAKLKGRRFHVLRGGDLDSRHYGYFGDLCLHPPGIRLAIIPKQ